jgi:hypothetical protein
MGGQVVPAHTEVLPPVPVPPSKKGKRGAKASRKAGTAQAPRSVGVRDRRRKFTKAMADQALIDAGVGTSDELPLVITQSFKDGRYSPSTGM